MNTIIQNSKFKIYNLNAVLCIICYSLLVVSCSQPTEDDQVTFSGTVTLEDTTNFSGVTVSLYAPVELDTALVRINQEYPNIGVQISQETEFDHREHEPLYTTTTKADGHWEIKAENGQYNLVAEKEGWGWKYKFRFTGKGAETELKKELVLKGDYNNELTIEAGRFVRIEENTNINASFTAIAGCVFYFKNNSTLKINSDFNIAGNENQRIYFTKDLQATTAKLIFEDNNLGILKYCNFNKIENGLYFKGSGVITIENSLFRNAERAVEVFNKANVEIGSSLFTNCNLAIVSNNSKIDFEKNILFNIDDTGVSSVNEDGTMIKNNLFEKCMNCGIAFNISGSPYSLLARLNYEIYYNDFINNRMHIYVGRKGNCIANQNNFWYSEDYIVKTSGITYLDSVNFKYNFWNYFTDFEINQKILDKADRIGEKDEGPFVNFNGFKTEAVKW